MFTTKDLPALSVSQSGRFKELPPPGDPNAPKSKRHIKFKRAKGGAKK